jgi:hypothetical protein
VAVAGNALAVATTVPFALLPGDAPAALLQALLLLRGIALGLALMPAMTAAFAAVDRDRLPDATTQVNIVMRVGGAVGGALLAVVLAGALPAGAEHAFHVAFWWLTAASVAALATAAWLWHAAIAARRPTAPASTTRPRRTTCSTSPS